MRLIVGFFRAVVAGLAVGGAFLLLAHVAGATERPRDAGVWAMLAGSRPNEKACGVSTHLANGADLRLVVADGEARLIAHHPGWILQAGQANVTVTMGGDMFFGYASVADRSTLVVKDLSGDFLSHFITSPVMTADLGGIRFRVDLRASDGAAWAFTQCASAAGLADTT